MARDLIKYGWIQILLCVSATGFAQAGSQGKQPLRLTYGEAINRSEAESNRLRISIADYQAQVERRRGAWSGVGPRVTADYREIDFGSKQTAKFGPQEIVIRDDKNKAGSLTIAQPVTTMYALIERARFEGAQEDMKELALTTARIETRFSMAELYVRSQQAIKMAEIADASVAAVAKQTKDAEAMMRVGRINRGDFLRLQLALSEAKARAAQAQAGKDIALATLRQQLGLEGDLPLVLDEEIPAFEEGGAVSGAEGANATGNAVIQNLPEMRQASIGVDLARYSKKFAYAGMTPAVNVFVKYDRNFGEPSGFGGGEKDTKSVGLQLSWEIWNNGSSIYAVREAAEQQAKAEAAVAATQQKLELDIYQGEANFAAARQALALAQAAVEQAHESYRIEQARFQTGSRSATDLILAESAWSGAKGRLVGAKADVLVWGLKKSRAKGAVSPLATQSTQSQTKE
jgi:outer membrane protein